VILVTLKGIGKDIGILGHKNENLVDRYICPL
jgi:hypothetical protein